jgi:hypothetical protein
MKVPFILYFIGKSDGKSDIRYVSDPKKPFIFQVKPINHHSHDLYVKNIGACSLQPPLPLPPNKGLPFELKTYADVDEPRCE